MDNKKDDLDKKSNWQTSAIFLNEGSSDSDLKKSCRQVEDDARDIFDRNFEK